MVSKNLPSCQNSLPLQKRFAAWLCIALQCLPAASSIIALPVAAQSQMSVSETADSAQNSLASGAKMLGTTLSDENRSSSEALSDYARGQASSMANSTVEGWLSQFGTVQSQLNVDKNFSLKDSSIDWLVPLYDSPQNILFTQLGARNKDDRNTVNLGIGVRHFVDDSMMYGFNAFFDNDLSGNNSRLGLGVELWQDYVQFSGNVYQRLSDWHQSRDFADYDERPANGYDVRVNGFLPAYPQLGGKLVYEQYFGDEVALFGQDERQKDPYAVTMGVNYTPIPMITLGAEQRMGKSGQNDFNLNLQLSYQLDRSWSENISPDAVDALRKLSHSRYDLVDRNNNIVLEYRKQQLVKLQLAPERIQAAANSLHSVEVKVQSKYPLQGYTWSGSSFFTAGGNVVRQDLNHIQLTVPPYKVAPAVAGADKATQEANSRLLNTYVLTASVNDIQGNHSSPAQLTVEVTPSGAQSDIRISNLELVDASMTTRIANGTDGFVFNATVTDADGNPVANAPVNWEHDSASGLVLTSNGKTDAKGVAMLTLTSTEAASNILVSATVANGQKVTADRAVNFTSAVVSVAGIVKDAQTNAPIKGASIKAYVNGESSPAYQVTSGDDGHYSLEVSPGTYNVKTKAAGYLDIDTTVSSGEATSVNKDILLYPDSVPEQLKAVKLVDSQRIRASDGVAKFTFKATVTDATGKPLPNVDVNWSQNRGENITLTSSSTTDASGIALATMTSKVAAQDIQVSAEVTGGSTLNADQLVSFSDKFADISGQVLSSLDSSVKISGATVKFYLKDNPNQAAFTVTTAGDGSYSTRIAQGTYDIAITAPGYFDNQASGVSYSEQSPGSNRHTFLLTPDLDVQARIVVTWDQANVDLDARLKVPPQNTRGASSGTPLDVNKGSKPANADAAVVQESSSKGPETVVISKLHSGGTYTFNVMSMLMFSSGHVQLSLSDGRTFEYDLKNASGNNKAANLWGVFEIDTSKGKVNVKTVNNVIY